MDASAEALAVKPAPVPDTGTVDLQDLTGTLDISSPDENTLNLRAHEALVSQETVAAVRVKAQFHWTGTFINGYTPFESFEGRVLGENVNLNAGWSGVECSRTTVVWNQRRVTDIGSATSNDYCNVVFLGTVTLPAWTGQRTVSVSGPAQIGDPQATDRRTWLILANPRLIINLPAIGTVTASLAWVPAPVIGAPDSGYWRLTRATYRFGHGQ
jgi:hypothetical protein